MFYPIGYRVKYISRKSVTSPAYEVFERSLNRSDCELPSCSLLSIGERTSSEQELSRTVFLYFFFFIFLPLTPPPRTFSRGNYSSVLCAAQKATVTILADRENRSVDLSQTGEGSLSGNYAYSFDSHCFFQRFNWKKKESKISKLQNFFLRKKKKNNERGYSNYFPLFKKTKKQKIKKEKKKPRQNCHPLANFTGAAEIPFSSGKL